MMRSASLLLLLLTMSGCARGPTVPSSASWKRRQVPGITLETPYEFVPTGDSLGDIELVTSVAPKPANQAIDIRIDAMRFSKRTSPPTLDEFAAARFDTAEAEARSLSSTTVARLEARQLSCSFKDGIHNESVVFINNGVYWHIDIFCNNKSLVADAQRVLKSIQLR